MSGLNFDQAANALFVALSLNIDSDAEELTSDNLATALLCSGFTARPVTLINHIPPAGRAQTGLLLALVGNQWLPVLGAGYETFVLAPTGRACDPRRSRRRCHAWLELP